MSILGHGQRDNGMAAAVDVQPDRLARLDALDFLGVGIQALDMMRTSSSSTTRTCKSWHVSMPTGALYTKLFHESCDLHHSAPSVVRRPSVRMILLDAAGTPCARGDRSIAPSPCCCRDSTTPATVPLRHVHPRAQRCHRVSLDHRLEVGTHVGQGIAPPTISLLHDAWLGLGYWSRYNARRASSRSVFLARTATACHTAPFQSALPHGRLPPRFNSQSGLMPCARISAPVVGVILGIREAIPLVIDLALPASYVTVLRRPP